MNRRDRRAGRDGGKGPGKSAGLKRPAAGTGPAGADSVSARLMGLAGQRAAALPDAKADFNLPDDPVKRLLAAERQRRALEDELAGLQQALAGNPRSQPLLQNVARLAQRLDRRAAALAAYQGWLVLEPGNAEARHMAAVLSGAAPARADDRFVAGLFDAFADTFDRTLTHWLDYRAPALVAAAARTALAGRIVDTAADLGCGTGLLGPEIRPLCRLLHGVDLSPRMLEKARARLLYDQLHEAEITGWLTARPAAFDLLLAADVLSYFGALDELLAAAHAALKPGGLLAATLEQHDGAGYRAGQNGRYAHSAAYLREAAAAAGFDLLSLAEETLRQEDGRPVRGLVFSLKG